MDSLDYGSWTDEEVAKYNVAALNLAIAEGLPGSENLDCIDTVDRWADQVASTTERYLPRFHRTPEEYDDSESQFRILCMVTVLQRDLGVRYNADFMEGPFDASDSRAHFIHGPLTGFGGTCVNLPILYVAIGRRLGYPLKYVLAKEHCFVRWSGADSERFNIEATSPGFEPRGDEYYHRSPRPLSDKELASGRFLRDLTPRQELASYLCSRAYVLLDNLEMSACIEAFAAAASIDNRYEGDLAAAAMVRRIRANLHGRIPDNEQAMRADIVRASPQPKDSWERWALPGAQDHLRAIASN